MRSQSSGFRNRQSSLGADEASNPESAAGGQDVEMAAAVAPLLGSATDPVTSDSSSESNENTFIYGHMALSFFVLPGRIFHCANFWCCRE